MYTRVYILSCAIHTHAHAQDGLYNISLEQYEVCRAFLGRGMGMNITAP